MTAVPADRTLRVIIPTYRRTELLPPLVQAIRDQLGDLPARILLVDNDSAQSAKPVALSLGVDYLAEPTPGIAAVRQAGLEAADTNDLVAMIDDDVFPEAEWLSELLSVWTTSQATAVMGFVRYVWPEGTDPWIAAGGFMRRKRPETGTRLSALATGNVLLDMRQIRAMGIGFDSSLGLMGGEDTLFGLAILNNGGTIVAATESVARDEIAKARTTREFVRRRAMSQGTARTTILTRSGSLPRRLAGRAVHLVGGVIRLVVFWSGARIATIRGDVPASADLQRRTWFAQGRILGAVGRITPEYARPSTAN